MNTFSSTRLSRDEFLNWLGDGGSGPGAGLERAVHRSDAERDVTLLWDKRRGELHRQPLLAIPASDMTEFFAFTGTYIATYKPFTAFFRVVPLELVNDIEGRRELAEDVREPFARLIAGAAIAERYLRMRSRPGGSIRSALIATKMTLSASLGAAVIAGYSTTAMSWLTNEWELVGVRADSASMDQSATAKIAAIWSLLLSFVRGEVDGKDFFKNEPRQFVSEFVVAALKGGVTMEVLRTLGSGLPKEIDPANVLAASREERILAFNKFVSSMGEASADDLQEPFMAGLLLAVAGNGSFDMLRSAKELANKSPSAIIWFGVCAALFKESNVLTTANCLGQRFVRDVSLPNDLFAKPQSDVNVFEYRGMALDPAALDQVLSTSSDAFCLELLPGVMTYVPRQIRDYDDRRSDDYRLLIESLQEIGYLVDRTQRRLGRPMGTDQREIFRSEPKPRGRQR